MDPRQLTGSVKVAILTNAIGRHAAQPLLDSISENERQLVYRLQSKLGKVPEELVERVAKEFLQHSGATLPIEENKEKEQEKADDTASTAQDRGRITNLNAIQGLEANQLLQLIKDEHPQTIALILVHLKPDIASDVLAKMSEELKSDVALRIANLDKVISGMVVEIDRVFEEILKNSDGSGTEEA
jgi:flagellar motor switch protein FliG